MIVYVDSKTDKVDLTKNQLEKLLKEEYDKGYKEGKKFQGSATYSCPWHSGCPYRNWNIYYTSASSEVPCSSSNNTITADKINNTTDKINNITGTITISTSNIGSKLE